MSVGRPRPESAIASAAHAAGSPADRELQAALAASGPLVRRAALFAIINGLLVLMPSWYMLEVYDRVVGSRNQLTLGMLTLLVLACYVLMQVIDGVAAVVLHEAGVAFERRLAPRVFDACFLARLRGVPTGGTQPLQDLRLLRDAFASAPLRSALEAPASLVFLVAVFALHPLLGAVTLVAALVQAAVGWANERATQPPLVSAQRAAREAQLELDAALRNAEVVETMGMLGAVHRRWMTRQREFLRQQASASERGSSWHALARLIQTAISSALLGLAAWLLLQGSVQDGAFLVLASIFGGRVLSPIVVLVSNWRTVVGARDAWQRLGKLLAAVPAPSPAMALPAPRGSFVAEALTVGAPGAAAPGVRGVSFALAPGEVLAVVGPSGAGKTTLARALVGLWPSAGGKARLDGADVFAWDKAELGPYLGYLPQGVELFDGTVADNIARFGAPDARRVEAAARKVGLHESIVALPQGYDTEIGADGVRLSGGQRQRIALARALYGDPVFVVLDEPNANLDEAGDAALAGAILMGKAAGTTFVLITHRTSVLAVADKMLVLADGTPRAFGPRDEVLAALRRGAQPHPQAAQRPAHPDLAGQGPAVEAAG